MDGLLSFLRLMVVWLWGDDLVNKKCYMYRVDFIMLIFVEKGMFYYFLFFFMVIFFGMNIN